MITKSLIWSALTLCIPLMSGLAQTYSDRIKENVLSDQYMGSREDSLDIYLLIGQSNMAGRADIEKVDMDSLEQVYLFNGSTWEKAANPLNRYSTVRKEMEFQKLGPGYSFAKKLALETDRRIGLVVNALGGTSIAQWQKGYTWQNDFDLFEQALSQVEKMGGKEKIKGIIWHQGENDQNNPSIYMDLLKRFIADLKYDLGREVPFFAGEIGKWRPVSERINQVIRDIPQQIQNAHFVSSDDLTPLNGDLNDPHFDSRSQRVLGERYAEKVLEEIYNFKK
jgi:hypothetical protein